MMVISPGPSCNPHMLIYFKNIKLPCVMTHRIHRGITVTGLRTSVCSTQCRPELQCGSYSHWNAAEWPFRDKVLVLETTSADGWDIVRQYEFGVGTGWASTVLYSVNELVSALDWLSLCCAAIITLPVSNQGLCPIARHFTALASSVDRDVNDVPVGRNWLRRWFQTLNLSFTIYDF